MVDLYGSPHEKHQEEYRHNPQDGKADTGPRNSQDKRCPAPDPRILAAGNRHTPCQIGNKWDQKDEEKLGRIKSEDALASAIPVFSGNGASGLSRTVFAL